MPSVSEAQRRKMAILYKQGKITKAQWEEYKVIRKRPKKPRKR
jgi:hypothetical protein